MNKFYSEIVLAEQTFAVPSGPEEEVAISKLIANEVKRLKLKPEDVQLSGHLIWTVGQSLPTADAAKTTV
jgi:translation elongation factor EF-Ts